MKKWKRKKKASARGKWIPYDKVLEFLRYEFDEEYADQQINLMNPIEGRVWLSSGTKKQGE